ncbi:excisionase family DNA binding protein [Breznakia sp. PF5-3]|nr:MULTISPECIES: helix-turn-helix domain-containing protein [unclassified Breznakia]MDF9823767.1 excisionase family DNA binding protein [Breznakia sp. PM6-1]MDF9834565.1 excisionase family DNA binding protein [Breznakia sp. PF5-3]MDF9838242.1 excisionase family DNA binding protein [Breznakia sp. PFB2-8]MDF9860258.1 excisionase family DNA binding protein [Breznakia sp. PH5-24]
MQNSNEDIWININEASEYLGVKTVTLRGVIKNENSVPAYKVGKQWKFKR